MNNPLRFGVLGTARIARRIVADLQSAGGIAVRAIASREQARAVWSAEQFGIGTALSSYQELIERNDIDAIYIPLPPSLHCQWALAAIAAGKHVLIEKPLCLNRSEAESIATAADRAGVQWLDATGWLHHPRTAVMRQVIETELGSIGHISVACSFFEPFQANDHRRERSLGGGCLLDLGWYAAGLCTWAAGSGVVDVAANEICNDGCPMRVSALLTFSKRRTAAINCGYDMASRKWFEVAGSERSLICDDFTRPWNDRPPRFWVHDRAGHVQSHQVEGHQELQMVSRFRDAILGQVDLAPLQQQALATQEALDRIADVLPSGST